MMEWAEFLRSFAIRQGLSDDLIETLVIRLSDRSTQQSDANLAAQFNLSEIAFKKRMAEIYQTFEPICPELASSTRGKREKLRACLWKRFEAQDSLKDATTPNNLERRGIQNAASFIGRAQELKQIHDQLQQGNQWNISAITGMAGVGKTELAIQYAKQYASDYPGGICWLYARQDDLVATQADIGTQILLYARVYLGLEIPDDLELSKQVEYCWWHWPRSGDVLVVLDDVTNYGEIRPYLPPASKHFKVLMTTRLKLESPIQVCSLRVLHPDQSLQLLAVLLDDSERFQDEYTIAVRLCEWLGHLPLGLELVGRYLALESDFSFAEILFRLQQKVAQKQALQDRALTHTGDHATWTMTAERGVEAAFELSWEVLNTQSQQLGQLLSLFALAPIPWELVEQVQQKYCAMNPENEMFDPEAFRDARRKLLQLHLVQQETRTTYLLHSLIREFFRSKLEGTAYDSFS